MKFFSTLVLASSVMVAAAELVFEPLHQQLQGAQGERALRGGDNTNLNGLWGQFKQSGMCVEKIEDPSDDHSDKAKFMPCDATKKTQMWQFDKPEPTPRHFYGGLLFNMDGGCLAIRGGDAMEGQNLEGIGMPAKQPQPSLAVQWR